MKKGNMLLTTKQFADLCHTTKETILHYDRIDILKPTIVQKNGYRFYSPNQYFDYLRINSLKALDIPLYRIKEIFEGENLSEYLSELEKAKNGIEEKIKEMELSLRCIENEIAYIEMNSSHPLGEPFLIEMEEYHFIVDDIDFYGGNVNESKILDKQSKLRDYICGEYLFYLFDYDEFITGDIKKCKVGQQISSPIPGYGTYSTEKGMYLMINGTELWNSFNNVPEAMINYMEEHNLKPASNVYFVVSKAHASSFQKKDELTSIYFKVENK